MNENSYTQESTQERKPKYTKEEYAQKMKEERAKLYQMSHDQALIVVSDAKNYLDYLALQGRLGYTATNTLLIMNQMPEATKVKDFEHWKEEKIYVRKKPKKIQILEPSGTFNRKDGTIGKNYTPKYVYDISQTSDSLNTALPVFEPMHLVKALTYRADIQPEIVSKESNLPRDVFYDSTENRLYIKDGLTPSEMVRGLMREYCKVESVFNANSEHDTFIIDSVAYALYIKFNIDPLNAQFANQATSYYLGMNSKEIKSELNHINYLYNRLKRRIETGLYVQQEKTSRHIPHAER